MFVMFTYHICSVFAVENFEFYMYNLQKYSHYSGALMPLLYSYVLLFSVLIILESNRNSKLVKNIKLTKDTSIEDDNSFHSYKKKNQIRIVSFLIFAILVYMLLRLSGHGYYSMGGIDRFDYRNQIFTIIDTKLYTYIAWLLPIPILGNNLGMKKSAFVFFSIYIFYLIWVGDKFGSIFSAIYFYILISWATKTLNKSTFKRMLCMVIVALLMLMLYIAYQVIYERGSMLEVGVYFQNRLTGGQSDLWWSVFLNHKDSGWHLIEFQDELKAIFVQPEQLADYNFGIYKMMRISAPSWVVNNYLSRGVRFAASTQASLFYYFKYTGLFLGSVFMALLYYFLINKAVVAYKRADIIESICYTMLISKAIFLTTMSGIDMIGDITTILAIFVLIYKNISETMYKRKSIAIINTSMIK